VTFLAAGTEVEIDAEIEADKRTSVSARANTDAATLAKTRAPRVDTEPGDADCDAATGEAIGTGILLGDTLGDTPSMHVVESDVLFETAPARAIFPEGHVTVPEQLDAFKPEVEP
jgi:hypothetical protein